VKVKIGEIVDAQEIADALGVCRRTVVSRARSSGAIVRVVGKDYVKRSKMRSFVSDTDWNLVAGLERPLLDAGELDTDNVVSRQDVAAACGCDPATVWRVARRMNFGVKIYGRRLLTKATTPDIALFIGVSAESAAAISERTRQAVNVRWSRWRAEKNGKTGKAAAGSRSRRSPAASR
jgi:hypothetical protein